MDPYYGREHLAKIAACFITHLFACPDYPPSTHAHAKLLFFIAYALHQMKLHQSVMFASLILLQRLKAREMCNYLEWELSVTAANPMLSLFETAVKKDFREQKSSYPMYPTSFVSKCAARAEASISNSPFQEQTEQSSTSSPVPGFTQNSPSGAKPGTPTKGSWGSDPHMLDTPSPTFSHTTSPASITDSPVTPVGGPDPNPKIRGMDHSPAFGVIEGFHTTHPLKSKMFAFTTPSGW
jgi:hypothetical protein